MVQFSKIAIRLSLATAALVMMTTFSGCEDDQKLALAKAEKCLNTATSATAMGCVSASALGESEKAYSLRCSARYIANGFTGTKLGQAFSTIKTNVPGADPMITALAVMAFTSEAEANAAESECQKSKVLSMMRFSRMSLLATQIGSFGGATISDGMTSGEVDAAILSLQGALTGPEAEAISATIVSAATDYCENGSSFEATQVCVNLETALASGTTPAAIVQALLSELQN